MASMGEARVKVQVAQAGLLAKGYIMQTDHGMWPTEEGFKHAAEVWMAVSDEDKLLLVPYLRKLLRLVSPNENG